MKYAGPFLSLRIRWPVVLWVSAIGAIISFLYRAVQYGSRKPSEAAMCSRSLFGPKVSSIDVVHVYSNDFSLLSINEFTSRVEVARIMNGEVKWAELDKKTCQALWESLIALNALHIASPDECERPFHEFRYSISNERISYSVSDSRIAADEKLRQILETIEALEAKVNFQ